MPLPDPAATERFYQASLLGLHALESAEGGARRFGPEADARWRSFAGHLGLADRIDLLLRDAAVKWGPAFSPARVFDLPGLASDEPFGPDWRAMDDVDARRAWTDGPTGTTLTDIARALGVEPADVALPALAPATHLCLAGGAAILATALAFAARHDLSWADQVLVVARKPEHRHLAGLAAPAAGSRAATRLVSPAEDIASSLQSVKFKHVDHAIVSPDADTASATFARRAGGR